MVSFLLGLKSSDFYSNVDAGLHVWFHLFIMLFGNPKGLVGEAR